jgi:hypothetical protein
LGVNVVGSNPTTLKGETRSHNGYCTPLQMVG